ncbi:MAG: 4Fe-4S binding protein [Methanomethylophilus sp.]
MFAKAGKALVRALLCTECGICAKSCPRHAIKIKGGMRVDPDKCTSCGRCESSCMVVHFYDKIMEGKTMPAPEKCQMPEKQHRAGPRGSNRRGYRNKGRHYQSYNRQRKGGSNGRRRPPRED